MNGLRPVPEPTSRTQPFWDAAARRELWFPRCESCDQAFFPPHLCCPRCRSTQWTWGRSTGEGTLYSYTVVHRAPQPGFDPPYVIGVVDLDEGFDLMTNIVDTAPGRISIGERVQVDWLEVDSWVLPVFKPARVEEQG